MELKLMIQVLAGITVLLAMVVTYLLVRLNNMHKKYDILMQGNENKSLQDMFIERVEQVNGALEQVQQIQSAQTAMRKQLQGCVQKLGVVRFDAYGDIAGELSYAIAVLDEHNDGVVFSCLTSRDDVRCYARGVSNSGSANNHALTKEEKQAVQNATNKYSS